MKTILITWLGNTDFRAVTESSDIGLGPVAQAIKDRDFDHITIISNALKKDVSSYIKWLNEIKSVDCSVHIVKLTRPTDFAEIYNAATDVINITLDNFGKDVSLTFHMSPGTPAMAAVWMLLAKTRFPAELIESSKEEGVRTASIPFDIYAEFIPSLLKQADQKLEQLSVGISPDAPEFDQIIHRSPSMKKVVSLSRKVALHSIPVLIEGETGTGKELFAKAIHQSSPRRNKPLVSINCGAIPPEIIESELFGYKKGAFTGASNDKPGYFEAAHEGTLFLDEIGEMPLPAQVKILRVLQEGKISRIGDTHEKIIDVRIIAATNRNLIEEISKGRFRSDLFYRVAVAIIKLPPLRERTGDLTLLINYMMQRINEDKNLISGYDKIISPNAINFMLSYHWPGNIRELYNTLLRAYVWSANNQITLDDIKEAVLNIDSSDSHNILNKPLGDGFDLNELTAEVVRIYLKRALTESSGNKTKAANLLGLSNYQTLTNWLVKYGVN